MNDGQEKTEEASQYKLDEARKKGQVPHSQELVSLVVVLTFLLMVAVLSGDVARFIGDLTRSWIGNADRIAASGVTAMAAPGLQALVHQLLPLFLGLILVVILMNLVFKGPVFSLTAVKPDFRRLDPVAGLKKLFSRRMIVELLKLLVKLFISGLVLFKLVELGVGRLLSATGLEVQRLPVEMKRQFLVVGFALAMVMLLSALFDMWYSRKEFARQMRMSRREVKDEYKRREGDPEIKNKRRRIQQELLRKLASLRKVKDADVILSNPTHVAIALQYRPLTMQAPVIIASGRGFMARMIFQVARNNGVPIIRRPPLARSLASLRLESEIPPETQRQVAEVYRWIISLPGNKVLP
ncbi:flagellar biosynthetic protein FlhB [Fluviicoccus keumensis]|uniref:Flagellar biosynthetic protein FlhB n=1 Tax=Fluviicoccus keumensis TaxID=1435465 RepID=A0A4Q7YLE3_9GAMM|nr:EscU/YscU/HrcU family type III secretion system export apparatus switch protein [Fluviicoccus keumensis]RZU38512.1 flagellar biosynthetic protein FlhB [Fluviicoccus keumensis]